MVLLACLTLTVAQVTSYDVVVYGGTSAGVMAAVQAKRLGKTVIIVCPDKHLGGLSSSGLGFTDTGDKAVIGGLARDFYHRVYLHYQRPEAWTWQKKSEYGNKGQGIPAIDGDSRTMWIFEPHVAEQIFEEYIREAGVPVLRGEYLDRESGVDIRNSRISEIRTLSKKRFVAKVFIDATYEGDLMAAAKVDYTVGREGKSTYGETWAGVQVGVRQHGHNFGKVKPPVSPYSDPKDQKSKVLARISLDPPGEQGSGDKRVQAYCYRMCLTTAPENRIAFPKPEGYDPREFQLFLRVLATGWKETFDKFDPIPNHKTDTNNHGPFSTDNIGRNYDYPEATYAKRREILKEHENYQKGWLYFLAHDPNVPSAIQQRIRTYGLPKDEFKDNGGWPHQIYVREARRMVGSYVMTEHELVKRRPTPQPVGMGSYGIDSHNVQRFITTDGSVDNEGDIGVSTNGPYSIAYGSLVSKKSQITNLLVPVAASCSHVAYGSIRMEPVFMILAQSAATAAALAIDLGVAVQDVPYDRIKAELLKDGQVLETLAK